MTRSDLVALDARLTRCGSATMASLHPNREHPPSAYDLSQQAQAMMVELGELHRELGRLIGANEIHASGGSQPG